MIILVIQVKGLINAAIVAYYSLFRGNEHQLSNIMIMSYQKYK